MKQLESIFKSLIAGICLAAAATAQAFDPPGDPASTNTAMPTLQDLTHRLATGATVDLNRAGFIGPTAPPAATTMPSLNDVMALMPAHNANAAGPANVRAGKVFWSLDTNAWGVATGIAPVQVVSPATNELAPGFYDETIWTMVETDLVPTNIRQEVVLFGVTGTAVVTSPWPALVPRTGWTNSFVDFDDGFYSTNGSAGEPWPQPRFDTNTALGAEVVLDKLTGLMWLRAPPTNKLTWAEAVKYPKGKVWGGTNDWRLPSVREFMSLLDLSRSVPALPQGHPFELPKEVNSYGTYYLNTRLYYGNIFYYYVILDSGSVMSTSQNPEQRFAWPVRGPMLEY
jgi:hypothetical protein